MPTISEHALAVAISALAARIRDMKLQLRANENKSEDELSEEEIDAHLELPGRAVFGFGPSIAQKVTELSGGTPKTDWSHARTVKRRVDTAPRLTMALALQGPDVSGRAGFERDVGAAREMGVPITAHIASADGGPRNTEIEHMEAWGCLGPDMTLIHCTGASDEDFATLDKAGRKGR